MKPKKSLLKQKLQEADQGKVPREGRNKKLTNDTMHKEIKYRYKRYIKYVYELIYPKYFPLQVLSGTFDFTVRTVFCTMIAACLKMGQSTYFVESRHGCKKGNGIDGNKGIVGGGRKEL